MGTSVVEFESLALLCSEDDKTFEGHVLVDYSMCSKKDVETKSKIMRDLALQRGWLYKKLTGTTPK